MDSGNDLFVYKAPEVPSSKIYTIRPYLASDEEAVYAVCNQISNCTGSSAVADKYTHILFTKRRIFYIVKILFTISDWLVDF